MPGRGAKGEVRERSPELRPESELHTLGADFDEQVGPCDEQVGLGVRARMPAGWLAG